LTIEGWSEKDIIPAAPSKISGASQRQGDCRRELMEADSAIDFKMLFYSVTDAFML